MIVSGEAVQSEMLAMIPGQKLFTKMASSAENLLAEAKAYALEVADVRPLQRVRICHASTLRARLTSSLPRPWCKACPRTSPHRCAAWKP